MKLLSIYNSFIEPTLSILEVSCGIVFILFLLSCILFYALRTGKIIKLIQLFGGLLIFLGIISFVLIFLCYIFIL